MKKYLEIKNILNSWENNSNRSRQDVYFLEDFIKSNIIVFKHKNINKTIKKLERILKKLKDTKWLNTMTQ